MQNAKFRKPSMKKKIVDNSLMSEFESLINSIKSNENITEEEICRQLGYNEGYISQTRSRGVVPVKFIAALKRALSGHGIKPPQREDPRKAVLKMGSQPITVQDYINKINQHNEYIQGLLALSLNDLSGTQKDMYAHLKAAIKRQAERFARMDPEVMMNELRIISTYADEIRTGGAKEGNPSHP